MTKNIVVVGAGPGISHAVAEKFGAAGFNIGLVARNPSKLAESVKRLEAKGYTAVAFPADASDTAAVRGALQAMRAKWGPITVMHWNAATPVAGDLLTAPVSELHTALNAGVVGLIVAVQELLPDWKRQGKDAALLVTNGGFGRFVDAVDAFAVQTKSMGLAIANSAKHKASRLLVKRLADEGVFAAEVMVQGTVKGTAWDQGQATLEASLIGERFWQLYTDRKEHFAAIG